MDVKAAPDLTLEQLTKVTPRHAVPRAPGIPQREIEPEDVHSEKSKRPAFEQANDTEGLGEKTTFHRELFGDDEGRTDVFCREYNLLRRDPDSKVRGAITDRVQIWSYPQKNII